MKCICCTLAIHIYSLYIAFVHRCDILKRKASNYKSGAHICTIEQNGKCVLVFKHNKFSFPNHIMDMWLTITKIYNHSLNSFTIVLCYRALHSIHINVRFGFVIVVRLKPIATIELCVFRLSMCINIMVLSKVKNG